MANYVRFQRGSLAAYEALKSAGRLDENTLYFIYDKEGSSVGSLYMGDKVISGGDVTFTSASLDELSDVIVAGAKANSFLVKNDEGNWIAAAPEAVAVLIQEYIQTASELTVDNQSLEIENDIVSLKNFGKKYYRYVAAVKDENGIITTPSSYELVENEFVAGLEPRVIVNNDGDLELAWYEPSNETIEDIGSKIESAIERVENLEESINTKANAGDVYSKEEADIAIAAAISNADHLRRKIVASLDEINKNSDDALHYIYMVPAASQSGTDDKYDEYVVIEIPIVDEATGENIFERKIEKVGSWEVDLSDYAKASDLEAISSAIENLTEDNFSEDVLTKLNFITNIDENNFTITDGQLQLNENAGRLITKEEIATLQAVSNGEFDNFITSVNEDIFTVDEEGKLDLKALPSSLLEPIIGDMSQLVTYDEKNPTTVVEELNNLYQILKWNDLDEAAFL